MRNLLLLAVMAVVGLALAGCPKKDGGDPGQPEPQVQPKAEEPPPRIEPKQEEPRPEVKPEEPGTAEGDKKVGAGGPEENCGALYDFTKQLSEAFAKKAVGKAARPLPPRDKFVAACKQLPEEVSRCMNPQVAMQEAEKCQKVMQEVDKEKIARFKRMLGGK